MEPKVDLLQRSTPAVMSFDLLIELPYFYINYIVFARPDAKLIELGYATTHVSLPQQNLSSGQLVFTLHVGRVAAIEMV